MRVLVTGGAGFIGSHLVDALRAQDADVIAMDSLDPGVHHGAPDYLRSDVDYCFADLRHWEPDARFADASGPRNSSPRRIEGSREPHGGRRSRLSIAITSASCALKAST